MVFWLLSYRESLDLISKGGSKLLWSKKKVSIADMHKEISSMQKKLEGEIALMKNSDGEFPSLNIEDIKKKLEEL